MWDRARIQDVGLQTQRFYRTPRLPPARLRVIIFCNYGESIGVCGYCKITQRDYAARLDLSVLLLSPFLSAAVAPARGVASHRRGHGHRGARPRRERAPRGYFVQREEGGGGWECRAAVAAVVALIFFAMFGGRGDLFSLTPREVIG